jgi:hypothetical protein
MSWDVEADVCGSGWWRLQTRLVEVKIKRGELESVFVFFRKWWKRFVFFVAFVQRHQMDEMMCFGLLEYIIRLSAVFFRNGS